VLPSPEVVASPQLDGLSPEVVASPQADGLSPEVVASPQLDGPSPEGAVRPMGVVAWGDPAWRRTARVRPSAAGQDPGRSGREGVASLLPVLVGAWPDVGCCQQPAQGVHRHFSARGPFRLLRPRRRTPRTRRQDPGPGRAWSFAKPTACFLLRVCRGEDHYRSAQTLEPAYSRRSPPGDGQSGTECPGAMVLPETRFSAVCHTKCVMWTGRVGGGRRTAHDPPGPLSYLRRRLSRCRPSSPLTSR